MRCGSKCFTVSYEMNGQKFEEIVTKRTPQEVRKMIKQTSEGKAIVLSVQEKK